MAMISRTRSSSHHHQHHHHAVPFFVWSRSFHVRQEILFQEYERMQKERESAARTCNYRAEEKRWSCIGERTSERTRAVIMFAMREKSGDHIFSPAR
jgi:hypothetical protein